MDLLIAKEPLLPSKEVEEVLQVCLEEVVVEVGHRVFLTLVEEVVVEEEEEQLLAEEEEVLREVELMELEELEQVVQLFNSPYLLILYLLKMETMIINFD